MFRKVLVANRGEIALRVISACREMGIPTVAVYSEPDRDSLHVRFADEDVCIGPAASSSSYLNIPSVISAAEISDADAIHPGYGFLSENPHFAEICRACNITFIGPKPQVMRLMGDKAEARKTMISHGLPVIPGSKGTVADLEEAERIIEQIGFPVIIKAAAGGGGRGMRVVTQPADLEPSWLTARAEAESFFGSPVLYVERWFPTPRHIEVQIMGDQHDNIVHLGERECSLQRRHQKVVEEALSPALDEESRGRVTELAVRAAQSIGYQNAGTVEFLMDEKKDFYFMEMNTRIQVEHPITELITGVDLIKEQIRSAAGERLTISQDQIEFKGHAIECRINAEDPETFMPSPGTIHSFHPAGGAGIRVDTAAHADCVISPHYDSMIMKLVAWGRDRTEAISRMKRALEMTVIQGVKTNIALHHRILENEDFQRGEFSTKFLEQMLGGTTLSEDGKP